MFARSPADGLGRHMLALRAATRCGSCEKRHHEPASRQRGAHHPFGVTKFDAGLHRRLESLPPSCVACYGKNELQSDVSARSQRRVSLPGPRIVELGR